MSMLTLPLLVLLSLLPFLAPSHCAPTPSSYDVFLFCAHVGPYADSVNVHYLQPLHLSTASPSPSPQNVSYSATNLSRTLFTTDLHGWLAFPVSPTPASSPLLLWLTGSSALYFSLDLRASPTPTPRLHWSYPLDERAGSHLTYLQSGQSYWGATAVNDIGGGPTILVLSIFRDVGKAVLGGVADSPVYQSRTAIGQDTAGICGVTADQANNILFLALATATFTGEQGSILAYSSANNSVLSQVDYVGAGTFGLVHSAQRQRLYTVRIGQENDQLVGVDWLDWKTGKGVEVIPQSALPSVHFWWDSLEHFFVDDTGEWYFTMGVQNQTTYAWSSWAFSVNVDSKRVSELVSLMYPSPAVTVMAIYARPSMAMKGVEQQEEVTAVRQESDSSWLEQKRRLMGSRVRSGERQRQ